MDKLRTSFGATTTPKAAPTIKTGGRTPREAVAETDKA